MTLMDLQMPGLHGIDAITAIREQAPNAAIIVLTTFAGDLQVRRALKAGAQAFLLKDVLHKELLDTIRSVHVIGQCIRHIGRNHPAPCSDDCGEARNSPSLAERYPK